MHLPETNDAYTFAYLKFKFLNFFKLQSAYAATNWIGPPILSADTVSRVAFEIGKRWISKFDSSNVCWFWTYSSRLFSSALPPKPANGYNVNVTRVMMMFAKSEIKGLLQPVWLFRRIRTDRLSSCDTRRLNKLNRLTISAWFAIFNVSGVPVSCFCVERDLVMLRVIEVIETQKSVFMF